MATSHLTKNRMRFSLSKQGQLEFVFSKFAFLVFGIIITASLFYLTTVQKEVQNLDENMRTAESVANIIGVASASPFRFSILYKPDINATLNFSNTSFDITSNGKTLTHPIYFPIQTNSTVHMDNCLNITRTNVTEVFSCQ